MRRLERHRPMTFHRAGNLLGFGCALGLLVGVVMAVSL